MALPGLVAAAVAIAGGIALPHITRAITHTVNKSGLRGEAVKQATERIEKSERIQMAIREAARELNKKLPGIDVPGVGRVTVADIPVIGLAAEKALVDSGVARQTVERVFKKYGIKADNTLIAVATSEAIRDRAAANLGSFLTETGAAAGAAVRIASSATKIVGKEAIKKGVINLANKDARRKLVGLITREAAIAGAAEGAANTMVQYGAYAPNQMRTDNMKYITDVASGALIGAGISGLAGFTLGTILTSPRLIPTKTDSPVTRGIKNIGRTTVDWAQELIDIQEKFGDIAADKILGNKGIKVGIITPGIPTVTGGSTSTSGVINTTGGSSSPVTSPVGTTQSTVATTSTSNTTNTSTSTTNTSSTSTSSTSNTSSTTSVTSNTPTFGPTINPSDETNPTDETDDTFDDTRGNDPTTNDDTTPTDETEPTITTPTPTTIPTPTLTPSAEYMPMPLMPAPYKEAPTIIGTAGRKIYVNELEQLKRMLRNMLNW